MITGHWILDKPSSRLFFPLLMKPLATSNHQSSRTLRRRLVPQIVPQPLSPVSPVPSKTSLILSLLNRTSSCIMFAGHKTSACSAKDYSCRDCSEHSSQSHLQMPKTKQDSAFCHSSPHQWTRRQTTKQKTPHFAMQNFSCEKCQKPLLKWTPPSTSIKCNPTSRSVRLCQHSPPLLHICKSTKHI